MTSTSKLVADRVDVPRRPMTVEVAAAAFQASAAVARDPWANDPDRATRHYVASIAPPTR